MKIVLLAGDVGSRLGQDGASKPESLVEIGGGPILWHIMTGHWQAGPGDFRIALGYNGEQIGRCFTDDARCKSDLTLTIASGGMSPHDHNPAEVRTMYQIDVELPAESVVDRSSNQQLVQGGQPAVRRIRDRLPPRHEQTDG